MFEIYGTPDCIWCERVKELFSQQNFIYIDLTENSTAQQMFREHGLRTVPQVFHYKKLIGGYEATKHYLENPPEL